MTPEEAKAKYEAEWRVLNAAKEAAMLRGDAIAAKKYRQQLSHLSDVYSARHELNASSVAQEVTLADRVARLEELVESLLQERAL